MVGGAVAHPAATPEPSFMTTPLNTFSQALVKAAGL
jgi:hypothetical protein